MSGDGAIRRAHDSLRSIPWPAAGRRAASRCVALPQHYSPQQYDLSSVVISRLVVVKCDAGKRDDAPASETSVLPAPFGGA